MAGQKPRYGQSEGEQPGVANLGTDGETHGSESHKRVIKRFAEKLRRLVNKTKTTIDTIDAKYPLAPPRKSPTWSTNSQNGDLPPAAPSLERRGTSIPYPPRASRSTDIQQYNPTAYSTSRSLVPQKYRYGTGRGQDFVRIIRQFLCVPSDISDAKMVYNFLTCWRSVRYSVACKHRLVGSLESRIDWRGITLDITDGDEYVTVYEWLDRDIPLFDKKLDKTAKKRQYKRGLLGAPLKGRKPQGHLWVSPGKSPLSQSW